MCSCTVDQTLGMSGLQVREGGGVNRAPKIFWGGVGIRALLTGTINQLL